MSKEVFEKSLGKLLSSAIYNPFKLRNELFISFKLKVNIQMILTKHGFALKNFQENEKGFILQ